jgi:Holliday junction DNA helicase RuvA
MVVREDGWTLYGFLDEDERTVFEQVQTVAGIGPRIALAVLDTMSPDDLRRAVVGGDVSWGMSNQLMKFMRVVSLDLEDTTSA